MDGGKYMLACTEASFGRAGAVACDRLDVSWSLRFLRSYWVLIGAFAIIGLVLGLTSWWIRDSSAHYRATHTLTFEQPPSRSTWAYQSIDGVALLATGGEVVERAAEARGLGADEVANRIITRTDESAGSVAITVIGRQREETQQLADALSASLQTVVTEREGERFAAERDRTISRLQRLADELNDLDARIPVASGAELDVLTAQRRGTFNQYSFAYEQFQQFTEQGTPSERLTTFDAALAIPIGAGDYEASKDAIAEGENHLRVDQDLSAELPSGSAGFGDGLFWRAVLGGFVGLMIGLGLALCADRLRGRARTRLEVEEAFAARGAGGDSPHERARATVGHRDLACSTAIPCGRGLPGGALACPAACRGAGCRVER